MITDRWRQARLALGWEPLDVVGRLKFTAARLGLELPPAYLLMQWLFLWENHRLPIPLFYVDLLCQVFDRARTRGGVQ